MSLSAGVMRRGHGHRARDVSSAPAIIAKRATAAGITGRAVGELTPGRLGAVARRGRGAHLVELQQAGDWKARQIQARYARHQLAARGAVAKLGSHLGQ